MSVQRRKITGFEEIDRFFSELASSSLSESTSSEMDLHRSRSDSGISCTSDSPAQGAPDPADRLAHESGPQSGRSCDRGAQRAELSGSISKSKGIEGDDETGAAERREGDSQELKESAQPSWFDALLVKMSMWTKQALEFVSLPFKRLYRAVRKVLSQLEHALQRPQAEKAM